MVDGRLPTRDIKQSSNSDVRLVEVVAATTIPNAWTPGDDDIPMEYNDVLMLYIHAAIDAGSAVTELRFRLSFDPDGTGTFYDETGADLQPPVGGIMDADLVDVEYVLAVAAGATYDKMFTLPVDAHIVRLSYTGDAVGADDELAVSAERMLRAG